MTDREILAELRTDVQWIKKSLANHLAHHEKFAAVWIGVGITAVVSIFACIITAILGVIF